MYIPREDKGIKMCFSEYSTVEDVIDHICSKVPHSEHRKYLKLYWHKPKEDDEENGVWLVKDSSLSSYQLSDDEVVELWEHETKRMFLQVYIEDINSVKCFKVNDTTTVGVLSSGIVTGIPECASMSNTHAIYLKTPEKETMLEEEMPVLHYGITPQSDLIFKKKGKEETSSSGLDQIVLYITKDNLRKNYETFSFSSSTTVSAVIAKLRRHFQIPSYEYGLWVSSANENTTPSPEENEAERTEAEEKPEGEWLVRYKKLSDFTFPSNVRNKFFSNLQICSF